MTKRKSSCPVKESLKFNKENDVIMLLALHDYNNNMDNF